MFVVEKTVLVFQTKMVTMPRKLRFRWTSLFWIINSRNDTYQVGSLAREIILKWVNGFRLKPYKGQMTEKSVFSWSRHKQPTNHEVTLEKHHCKYIVKKKHSAKKIQNKQEVLRMFFSCIITLHKTCYPYRCTEWTRCNVCGV